MDTERAMRISALDTENSDFDELCKFVERRNESYAYIMGQRYEYLDRIRAVLEEGFTQELFSTLLSSANEPIPQNIIRKLKTQYGNDVMDNIKGYSVAREIEDVSMMQYHLFRLRIVGVPIDGNVIWDFYEIVLRRNSDNNEWEFELNRSLQYLTHKFLEGDSDDLEGDLDDLEGNSDDKEFLNFDSKEARSALYDRVFLDPMLIYLFSRSILPNRFGAEICSDIKGILTSCKGRCFSGFQELCFDFYDVVGQYCSNVIPFPEKLNKLLDYFNVFLTDNTWDSLAMGIEREIREALRDAREALYEAIANLAKSLYNNGGDFKGAKSAFLKLMKLQKKSETDDDNSIRDKFEEIMVKIFDILIRGYCIVPPENFDKKMNNLNTPISLEEVDVLEHELKNLELEEEKEKIYWQTFTSLEAWCSKIEEAYMNQNFSIIENDFIAFLERLPKDEYEDFVSIVKEIFSHIKELSIECEDIDYVDELIEDLFGVFGCECSYDLENKVESLRSLLERISINK